MGDAQRYSDAAQKWTGQLGRVFVSAHDDEKPEIDKNTLDASAGLTGAENQLAIVNASRQIEAGEDRGVNVAALGNTKMQAEQQRKKAEKAAEDTRFVLLLDQASAYSAQLGREVAAIEAGYEAKYGDAWREQIALEVLGPDEMPEREDGESITDYRERLENTLLDRMIDPATGKVRPEYEDSEHKQWAERRYKQRQVDSKLAIAKDESRPQSEREEALQDIIDERDDDEISYSLSQYDRGTEEYGRLQEGVDANTDDVAQESRSSTDLNSFLAP